MHTVLVHQHVHRPYRWGREGRREEGKEEGRKGGGERRVTLKANLHSLTVM